MYHSHQGCFVCIRSSKSPKNVTLTPGKAQRALKIIAINSGGFMKYLAYKSQAFSNIKLQTWSYSPWTYSVKFPIFYNTNFYAYWYIKTHCTAWHKSESLYRKCCPIPKDQQKSNVHILKSEVAIASLFCQCKQTKKNITSKNNNKIDEKWDCWVCQILQFTSKRQV